MSTVNAIQTEDDLRTLDAALAGHGQDWWDAFYGDRSRPCPFFVAAPDESLVNCLQQHQLRPGRALDLGCGNGRNAVYLASRGYSVDAVDYSGAAIDWAAQRAAAAGVRVNLIRASVFELQLADAGYDLVYDSGCFHHIAPHRRAGYVRRIASALAPGGWFAMVCFRPEGGSGLSDEEVYQRGSLGGGLGYTDARLREVWSDGFTVREIRQMQQQTARSGLFGEPFLWSLWAQRS